jgi:iron complex outermembrane recepter protein
MSSSIQACFTGIAFTLFAAASAPAAAQEEEVPGETRASRDSAATSAEDAFGASVGINQVGLYSPYQTRGFDLISTSGASRIDGFYFHPAALPSESLVSGSSINVGIAATALDLPLPTGVVGYRLRDPGKESSLSVTAGTRGFGSPSVEALGTLLSDDGALGIVAHTFISPEENWSTGQEGARYEAGAVARWSPAPGTRLRVFGGISRQTNNGDLAVLPDGAVTPPPLRMRHNYSVDWARSRSTSGNFGAIVEHRTGDWLLGASAVRSTRDSSRADTTVLSIDGAGRVRSTLYHTPEADARSDSAEVKAFRTFNFAGATHRVGLAYRQRHSVSRRADAIAVPAGSFDIRGNPVAVAQPNFPTNAPLSRDEVNQSILSATYELSVGDDFELRLGAHRNRYEKTFRDTRGEQSALLDKPVLFSASGLWNATSRLHFFASYVAGLEESGIAPDAALNRGAVLPPAEARQYEIGARFDLTPRLGFILAGFDIRKPTYGLRPDSIYAPIGTVRHRGIEASLTGQLTSTTTVVLGANIVQARISGEQVDVGLVNAIAPGVSSFNATIAFEQKLTNRWSIDTYILYEGSRRRDNRSEAELGAVPFGYLGTRYDAKLGGAEVSLRAQLVNMFDRKGYYATPYGPLVPVTGQHWRLLLTTRL